MRQAGRLEQAAADKAAAEKAAADKAASDAAAGKIAALPASDKVAVTDKAAIEEARKAFDALTADQKKLVDDATLKKLTDAETALAAAEKAAQQNPAEADSTLIVDENKGTFEITSTEAEDLTVAYKIVPDKNDKKVSVPATVNQNGKTYTVTSIDPDAFKDSKATTVTIGQNVKKISPKAFNNSRVTTIVVKTKKLNKSSVKKALKGCKSKKVVVKVSVGSNEENRKYKKKYKKIFKKKNVGKKVSVKEGKVSMKK